MLITMGVMVSQVKVTMLPTCMLKDRMSVIATLKSLLFTLNMNK